MAAADGSAETDRTAAPANRDDAEITAGATESEIDRKAGRRASNYAIAIDLRQKEWSKSPRN
ncbi:hypothetical protein [Mycobacterium palustre]|uniref:hypothetical protein n=1 Tax=Mycobacterium palustre TaxID=153971 RepID=UPI00114E474B|nr:hypothetical protein [Mycobacterium palustre]MCV7103379.1 hypothetical protein [Mycobacterium palustre]